MDQPDYIVDIKGLPAGDSQAEGAAGAGGRPWLAIRWRCCGVYSRIYRNSRATAYEGRCPRCGRALTVEIGAEGTSARFFDAF
jgi:hypothetical protein